MFGLDLGRIWSDNIMVFGYLGGSCRHSLYFTRVSSHSLWPLVLSGTQRIWPRRRCQVPTWGDWRKTVCSPGVYFNPNGLWSPIKTPDMSKFACSPGVYTVRGPKKYRPPRFLDRRGSISTQYRSGVFFYVFEGRPGSIFLLLVPAWWFLVTTSPVA